MSGRKLTCGCWPRKSCAVPYRPGASVGRVDRVAQLLTAIGALDDEVAGQIVADFGVALAARQADARYRRALLGRSLRRSAGVRSGWAMPASSRSPAPARYRAGWSGWAR